MTGAVNQRAYSSKAVVLAEYEVEVQFFRIHNRSHPGADTGGYVQGKCMTSQWRIAKTVLPHVPVANHSSISLCPYAFIPARSCPASQLVGEPFEPNTQNPGNIRNQ